MENKFKTNQANNEIKGKNISGCEAGLALLIIISLAAAIYFFGQTNNPGSNSCGNQEIFDSHILCTPSVWFAR